MRWFLLVAIGACGGAAGPAEPRPVAAEEEPAPAPADEDGGLDAALAKESDDACTRACARISTCASAEAAEGCEMDCQSSLSNGRGSPAVRYAACLESLSCGDIKKSMSMNMGPAGECYANALRMSAQ
jgi:hypothetical protein